MDDLLNYTSDVYHPTTNSEGNYVDSHVNLNHFSKCGCGSSNHFTSKTFKTHFTSDRHKKWIDYLNSEKTNHYSELVKYKKLNKQQQMVIQQQQDMITTNEIKLEQYSKKVFEYKKIIESIKELKNKLEHCQLD
jgi:hypothetical protein